MNKDIDLDLQKIRDDFTKEIIKEIENETNEFVSFANKRPSSIIKGLAIIKLTHLCLKQLNEIADIDFREEFTDINKTINVTLEFLDDIFSFFGKLEVYDRANKFKQ